MGSRCPRWRPSGIQGSRDTSSDTGATPSPSRWGPRDTRRPCRGPSRRTGSWRGWPAGLVRPASPGQSRRRPPRKAPHESPWRQPVAVVHQPAELLAHVDGHLRLARRDEARVVGLDLVINVVGALVELGMAGVGRGDAGAEVLAPGVVGAPEGVPAVGGVQAGLANRRVQSVLLERAQEGHLHVDVILLERVVDQLGLPDGHLVGRDDLVLELELGGRAPGSRRHLAHPAGLHLVPVFRQREAAELGFGRGGR